MSNWSLLNRVYETDYNFAASVSDGLLMDYQLENSNSNGVYNERENITKNTAGTSNQANLNLDNFGNSTLFNGTNNFYNYTARARQREGNGLKAVTINYWLNPVSTAQFGTPWANCTAATNGFREEFDNTNGFVFRADWTTQAGKWATAKPATGAWLNRCVTYDWASTASVPNIWHDSVLQVVTAVQAPTGTKNNNLATFLLSGLPDGSNLYSGKLALFRMWGRKLTGSEIAQLYINPWCIYKKPLSHYLASPPTLIKTFNGLAKGSIKTINGLAIASVKTINGLT